jgi:VWFA-related protein
MNGRLRFFFAVALLCCGFVSCFCCAAQTIQPSAGSSAVQVEVNRILVPVVVRDSLGHTVGDLKREDFQVFDDEKPRRISGFTAELHDRKNVTAGNLTANQTLPGPPASSSHADRFIVFLFDDLHLSADDLTRVKKSASGALAEAVAGSGMAAVATVSGTTNSGLSRDADKLTTAMMSIQPHRIYQADGRNCGDIDYYQADLITNKNDGDALLDAQQRIAACNPAMQMAGSVGESVARNEVTSAARRAMDLGLRDTQETYAVITDYVRRMARLPGQRTLVLISPGFLNLEPDSVGTGALIVELAAQSNVVVSAIDARGLFTDQLNAESVGAGEGGANLEYRRTEMRLAMDPMAELANGTGGTFFHNNNNLDAGFEVVSEGPPFLYLLELPVDGVKADGSWHRLAVKVDRSGLDVQARRRYRVPRPEKKKAVSVPTPLLKTEEKGGAVLPSVVAPPVVAPPAIAIADVPGSGVAVTGPTLSVTSRLVFLDVTVLDKNDRPVTSGLTKDDFKIAEDKKPQPTFSFEAPEAHPTEDTGADPFDGVSRTIFVLDLLNSNFQDFSLIRDTAEKFFESEPAQLKSPTELFVLGNQSLELMQNYTRSRDEILFALKNVPAVVPYKDGWFFWERFGQSIDGLRQIAIENKGVPGRKNVVWVGAGGPSLNTSSWSPATVNHVEQYVHSTTNMLVDARISLFMILQGVRREGVNPMSIVDAGVEIGETDPFAGDVSFGVFVRATGGAVGTQIERSLQLASEYYTLTYQPHAGEMDGKFRRIRVTVSNPAYHVVTKAGYFAPTSGISQDPRLQTIFLMEQAARSKIPLSAIDLKVSTVVKHPDSLTAGLTVVLKGKNVLWQSGDDGNSTTHVHLATASLKANGEILASKVQSVAWTADTRDPARLAGDEIALTVTVRVPEETRRVRVIVATANGEQMGTVDVDRRMIDSAPSAPSPEPQLVRRQLN